VGSRRGSSTLLLRLGPVTSRSSSILACFRNCTGVDDVRVRNQWSAFDALTALLSGIHWGILSLSRALRAHWVDNAWGNHLGELIMLLWTTGEELRVFLIRIVSGSILRRGVVDRLRLKSE